MSQKQHLLVCIIPLYCKERFSMNSLFASNFMYSYQIFALMFFLVIHTTEFA